jgi:hypothetical protein
VCRAGAMRPANRDHPAIDCIRSGMLYVAALDENTP